MQFTIRRIVQGNICKDHFQASKAPVRALRFDPQSLIFDPAKGWQVLVVDYNNAGDLRFKLAGVDTVISTINGKAQLDLIDAAAYAHVRRFVPSEFGGPPAQRPEGDPLDNQQRAAISRLSQLESQGMSFTVFTCGILYERFAPGGMSSSQIGVNSAIGREGKYMLNIRQRTAQLPYNTPDGHSAKICLTGARDVAQFVVAAMGISSWPREFRMRGERMSVRELVSEAEHALSTFLPREFHLLSWLSLLQLLQLLQPVAMYLTTESSDCTFRVDRYTRTSLGDAMTLARAVRDEAQEMQLYHLIATAEGRYDFPTANLNQAVNHQPEKFRDYLARVWAAT
ncbi:hypothetical protein DV736_g3004, partial [Chaetothyriales sp. CBS 134916]